MPFLRPLWDIDGPPLMSILGGGLCRLEMIELTYKDAMEYPFIVERIEVIRAQMADFEQRYYKIAEASSDRELHKYNDTWHTLNKQLLLCEAQRTDFENWLTGVKDRWLQTIMFMRFVDRMTWAKIGEKMNCKATTARKAVQRYMAKDVNKKHEN